MFTKEQKGALERMNKIRAELKAQFIQRDNEVDGLGVALLAGTNMLLLGPPGTAKSLLTQVFARALAVPEHEYFERLCNAYTVPEDIFGPFDLPKLEQGVYERQVDGYLPKARIAYLDEIFNMNQTQLNTLNTVLNEKKFDQGTSRIDCPLELCVGAANVYPEGDMALAALYDRFLIRYWTPYINTRSAMRTLLVAQNEPSCSVSLQDGDTELLRQAQKSVVIPDEVVDAVLDVRDALARKGVIASDRRWRSMLKLIRAKAALELRSEAKLIDVMVLADSLWDKHDDRPVIYSTVAERVAPAIGDAQRLLDGVLVEYAKIDIDAADENGYSNRKQDRSRVVGVLNVALREVNGLQGSDDCAEINAIIEKLKGMKKTVARASAKLDYRVGHLVS
jgi:MoxR-like ATPase